MSAWRLLTAAALCAAAPRLDAQAVSDSTSVDSIAVDTAARAAVRADTAADSASARTVGDSTAGPRISSMAVTFRSDTGDTRPRAIEYSNAYGTRLAIHRYASYAELPLFAAEYALGQRILNGERTGDRASDGTRSAHKVVAGGLGVLFAVNTVTGVWNLVEARHDPSGRTRRNLHALGMLVADAGFLWTASLAGDARESLDAANRHRNAAIASISVATVSTVMMWLWKD
ncbi:MAG TPA: hypothetical protein VFJ81_03485 [Gemmatimonadales bacterium]|nr:hypothetical protein [Gemmatimonadales bacterium]